MLPLRQRQTNRKDRRKLREGIKMSHPKKFKICEYESSRLSQIKISHQFASVHISGGAKWLVCVSPVRVWRVLK